MSWNRCRASSGLLNDWAFLRQWEMDVPCKCHSPKFVISTISIYSNRNDHLNLKWFYFSGNIEINVHQWRKWQFQFTFELTRLTSDKLVPYQCESVKCLSVATRICSASATKLFRLAVNKKKKVSTEIRLSCLSEPAWKHVNRVFFHKLSIYIFRLGDAAHPAPPH